MILRNRASFISVAGMYLGLAMVAGAVWLTLAHRSPRYWPLLVAGLVIGCVSTPFYYYFKAKAKNADPYAGIEVQTLARHAEIINKDKNG